MKDVSERPQGPGAWLLLGLALFFGLVMILLPVISILFAAFAQGAAAYFSAISRRETIAALRLSLWVMGISLPLTALFGISAAWAITRFDFFGKKLLLALIDVPISLSPIVVGLMFVLLYGRFGIFGGFLQGIGLRIIFAPPGLVLTTLFILIPFVVRELIPTMLELGSSEEEAARILGASGFRMFWHVTLPNIRWALLYGLILSAARAIGEFGAASVVSGLIRGSTVTLPLQIEIYYNEYMTTMAFASSTLFFLLGGVTLAAKHFVGQRKSREVEHDTGNK
ncbi:sulfate ABC transporter permease [Spirochaeta dissipatitropha]